MPQLPASGDTELDRGRCEGLGELECHTYRVRAVRTGGHPQREVVARDSAGIPVVGLAVRIAAVGGLQVDPAHRTPPDGEHDLARQGAAYVLRRIVHDARDDDGG